MQTIKLHYTIQAPVAKVWKALTDPDDIEAWGAGPAVMDEMEGTDFSLWDGDIHGTNVEVIPEKKLVQEWYGGNWDKPSIVTITLVGKDGKTDVLLVQVDVPSGEVKDIEEGWEDFYMGPLKEFTEEK